MTDEDQQLDLESKSFKDVKIVVAEDQRINLDVLKGHLQEIGVYGDCAFCIDGQQTIDTCKEILDLAINDTVIVTDT